MKVDRKWVERNLGYDPITKPPPDTTFAFAQAAQKRATTEDLQREIIDFDSESPAGLQFMAFSTATGLPMFPGPRDWRPRQAARRAAAPIARCHVRMCLW